MPNERRSARWTPGRFPSLTVDRARAKVERAQVLLRDGVDPNPKHAHLTLPAPIILFSTLAEQFLEQHSKAKKKSWRQDQGWINLYLLPAWKDMPVRQIRRRCFGWSDTSTIRSEASRARIIVTEPAGC
jgi:hypothetical protein